MAPKRNYTKEQMAKAIEDVNRGEKVAVAALKYGVPRITLRNKITGKSPRDCNFGPATVLSDEEEKVLVQWVLHMSERHFPVTKDNLLDSVQKLMVEKKLDTCPFTNNRPGKKWYASFLRRHPELKERTAQNLSRARENVTEEELRQWFDTNLKYFDNKGLVEALTDPNRVFNADESAFFLQPKIGRVLVRKGDKNVYNASGDEKENLTVLITGNAAGILAPPMVIYPYERIPTHIANSVNKEWGIGKSDSGWMCSKTFYEYVANVFNPWLQKMNIPKPIIFFLDGHRSHLTLHLAELCKSIGIEIIALHPNSTHLLQPMDVAVFRPLKVFWKKEVSKWKTDNPGCNFKKEHFAPVLEAALENVNKETIKNGFRKSGIHPFSVEYVDMTKLSSSNRTFVNTDPEIEIHTKEKLNLLNALESEIHKVFSEEKITLFSHLFYSSRTEFESVLPIEDKSLYAVWAKIKGELDLQNDRIQTPNKSPCTPITELQEHETNVCQNQGAQEIEMREELLKEAVELREQTRNNISLREDIGKDVTEQEHIVHDRVNGNNKNDITSREDIEKNIREIQDIQKNKGKENSLKHIMREESMSREIKESESKIKAGGINNYIPSPFKRVLFWPEPEVKKRRTRERLPSAITSELWINYSKKKEDEKKKKEEDKEKRMKERKDKKLLKEKIALEKKENKKNNKTGKMNKDIKKRYASSTSSDTDTDMEIEYLESEYDIEEEYSDCEYISIKTQEKANKESGSKSEENYSPSSQALAKREPKRGEYVIIKYEGEYFPGLIENIDKGQFEISTMVLSKNNTFRWPETADKIWYTENDIIEIISKPSPINKRGFFKVEEMSKYLPYISYV